MNYFDASQLALVETIAQCAPRTTLHNLESSLHALPCVHSPEDVARDQSAPHVCYLRPKAT
jgi:hypothetical protein